MASDIMRQYIQELYEQCQPLLERPETIPEAIEKLKLIINIDPNFVPANYSLGYAHFLLQEFEKAMKYLQKAKELGYPEEKIGKIINEIKVKKETNSLNRTISRIFLKLNSLTKISRKSIQSRISIFDVVGTATIFIMCYYLLSPSIATGYPRYHLDATMAFYIAKIKMLLQNKSLFTKSWYFGYEMLKYYPPLSTYLPAFLKITGELLTSYYIMSFLFYSIFCIGVYVFTSNFLKSKIAGIVSGTLWVFAHINYISFQGHYWENCRLFGTALVPWALYYLHRTMKEGEKKNLMISIALSSYVLLSNLLSAVDLALLVGPYLIVQLIPSKKIPSNDDVTGGYRGLAVTVSYSVGVLALTLWWYIPSVFPNGLSAYLTGSSDITPPIYETFLQFYSPRYIPAVQLPITLLGLSGILIGVFNPSKEWFLTLFWLSASLIISYIVKIKSFRVVLIIGLCLVLGAGYFTREVHKRFTDKTIRVKGPIPIVAIIITIGVLSLQYLPRYQTYSVVDETYLSTDEYKVSTWLAKNAGINYRVYVMWGRWFRGSQWLNTFYPDIKQVLGGYDEGMRAVTEEPFIFDSLVKWQEDATELHSMAQEYNVKYIVIDKKFMQSQSSGYVKFSNTEIFQPQEEINDLLRYAAIYEIQSVSSMEDGSNDTLIGYQYWTYWRYIGLSVSSILLVISAVIIRRLRLK
jgi:tetratricopeptide (TPR) repeat protein